MTAMWLMLLVFGVDPWVGIVPALAYGLSTYFLLIIGAGHITKMWALVYAPLMMGGAWMTLRGNMWAGRCAHGAHGVARNRRQPPADHLLFPAGRVRLVLAQRRHRRPCREKHLEDPSAKRTAVLAAAGHAGAQVRTSHRCGTPPSTRRIPRAAVRNWPRPPGLPRSGGLDARPMPRRGATAVPRAWNLLIPDFMGARLGPRPSRRTAPSPRR